MKKRLSYLDKYVIFSLGMLIVYTIIEITGPIAHDTLTVCFFGTFGGEILSCALIKIFKLQRE